MKKVSEKSINAKVINVARKLGVGDVNRVRIVVALERLIARLMTRSYLRENIVFNGVLNS